MDIVRTLSKRNCFSIKRCAKVIGHVWCRCPTVILHPAIEHIQTEASCDGTPLYIDNSLNYTIKNDLTIYKKKELESIFIEVMNPKGKNLVIGCIYRHPSMKPTEFIDVYMSDLLQKKLKRR